MSGIKRSSTDETSGQGLSLFPTFAASSVGEVRVGFPRFVWANTTVRQPFDVLKRFKVLVEAAPQLTVAKFPTGSAYKAEIGRLFAKAENVPAPVAAHVVDKVLLTAERWGALERLLPSDGGAWLRVYPAAEAFLTDPDPIAMFACLLLQDMFDDTTHRPTRHNVGLLSFINACHTQGITEVRVDWVAYFMAVCEKEGPWALEVTALNKYLGSDFTKSVTAEMWIDLADPTQQVRTSINAEITALIAQTLLTRSAVIEAVAAIGTRLLPNARETQLVEYAHAIADDVIVRDTKAVKEKTFAQVFGTKIDSQCDMVSTALGYLDAAGLLAAKPAVRGGKAGKRFALTSFGKEALSHCGPTPKSGALARNTQRATTHTPFAGRTIDKQQRFTNLLTHNTTSKGRTELALALDWEKYKGLHVPHKFEWAVVQTIFALTTPHPKHQAIDGVRTILAADFASAGHAPGRGCDSWLQLENGTYLLIEATGETGRKQISHELESVIRHWVEFANEKRTREVATIFVAPLLDPGMVYHLFCEASGAINGDGGAGGETSALVIPVTTNQLQRLLKVGKPLNVLIEQALEALKMMSASSASRTNANKFLDAVEQLVETHCTTL